MVKKIIMRGVKSEDSEQELTGRDIITGPNGSGKTTRAQALGIALMGYVPGAGKLPAETMKLACGDSMAAGAETGGFAVLRTFTRKGDKVEQEILLNPPNTKKQGDKMYDKERRIRQELGAYPVMLDFGEFLGLSDAKRREFIYGLAGAGDNPGADRQLAGDTLRSRLELPLTADPMEKEILGKDITECMGQYPAGAGAQEGLQAVLDYAKGQLSYWKKERDAAVGATQKMSEYKNKLAETDRDLDADSARLEEAQKDLAQAVAELAMAEGGNRRLAGLNGRIKALSAEIAAIEAETSTGDASGLYELIAQYSGDIQEADNSAAIREETVRLEWAQKLVGKYEPEVELHRDHFRAVQADKTSREALLSKIEGQSGQCPIDARISCSNDFSELVDSLGLEVSECEARMQEIAGKGAKARALLDEASQSARAAQEAIDGLRKQEVDTLRENEQIRAVVRELQAEAAEAESFDAEKAARLAASRGELAGLAPDGGGEWPLEDTGALSQKAKGLEVETQALKEKVAEQAKARNALASLNSSMVDSVGAGYHSSAFKSIAEAVGPNGLQGELVKGALAPLAASIQAKLGQMGVDKTFYFQTEDGKGKEVFQFGWRGEDGSQRNFDALSTGEQMLLLIALMTTVIERLDPPLKVLCIDNAENLDGGNLKRVLNGLEAAGENLDNILFCGVMDIGPADFPGWRVWDLGGGAG